MSPRSRCSSTIVDRKAGGPYADFDTIEVSRRIEREAGSVYRINGRDVRQRDVQIFFADASSGAGSTAFVRQGQIGLLISQKPLARRAILEEAAGIGGLHQRRHEAELRLRAAETNLSRLEDVIREVEASLPASSARRARPRATAIFPAISARPKRWRISCAGRRLRPAPAQAAEELAAGRRHRRRPPPKSRPALHTAQSDAAAILPPLRQAEAEKSAAHHRLIVQREQLDAEEARAREAAQRIRQLIAQGDADIDREQRTGPRCRRGTRRCFRPSVRTLEQAAANAAADIAAAEEQSARPERETGGSRSGCWNGLPPNWPTGTPTRPATERGRDLAAGLLETSAAQLGDARARLDRAMENAHAAPDVAAADRQTEDGARRLRRRACAKPPRRAHRIARKPKPPKPPRANRWKTAEREVQRLSAEVKALGDLLHPEGEGLFPPLVDAVTRAVRL